MHQHHSDHHEGLEQDFVPGLGRHGLTRLYDPFTRLLGLRSTHRSLVDQAEVPAGGRVLEIGCGTAEVALQAKRTQPSAEVHGLDPDPLMLARAGRKAQRAGLALELTQGFAEQLPFPDAAFDRVLAAYMFHHLHPDARVAALGEVARVLRPGGSLHLLDFGGSSEASDGWLGRRMRRNELLRDNYGGRIPTLMTQAGLVGAVETGHQARFFGGVAYYRADAPR
jgi:ubiquinone/menaquinone biosynthesis C-methylase UbiE